MANCSALRAASYRLLLGISNQAAYIRSAFYTLSHHRRGSTRRNSQAPLRARLGGLNLQRSNSRPGNFPLTGPFRLRLSPAAPRISKATARYPHPSPAERHAPLGFFALASLRRATLERTLRRSLRASRRRVPFAHIYTPCGSGQEIQGSCGGVIRTRDLKVMSLASYLCSTPH